MNKEILPLHYITQNDIPGRTLLNLTEEVCAAGIRWVQVRIKNQAPASLKTDILRIKEICHRYNARLIINDSSELARLTGADGVHLGRQDMPVAQARALLGNDFIIGATANSALDLDLAIASGADYVGLGPYRFTTTKQGLSPVLGLDGIAALTKHYAPFIPIIAIGGIRLEDINPLLETGICGVAIASGINAAPSPTLATHKYQEAIAQYKAQAENPGNHLF